MSTQLNGNGCAFCRSRHLSWTNHLVESCINLANHLCTYCKQYGHTNSRCPKSIEKIQKEEAWKKREEEKRARWEANQKAKKEKKERKASHFKENCWASIAVQNLSSTASAKIANQHDILDKKLEREASERHVRKLEEKRLSEVDYPIRMAYKYGLSAPILIPQTSWNPSPLYLQAGEFWYYYTEPIRHSKFNKSDDSELAETNRNNPNNIRNFRSYLHEVYGPEWVYKSKDTKDDCFYLQALRQYKAMNDDIAYFRGLETEKKQKREEEEEKEERQTMEELLQNGAISKEGFTRWKRDKEQENDKANYAYEMEGSSSYQMQWYSHEEEEERQKRQEARENFQKPIRKQKQVAGKSKNKK